MTSYSGMTPRDLPEAREDLVFWASGVGDMMARQGRPGLGIAIAASARAAELYFVTSDMTHLARTIGAGMDVYALASDMLPAPHGLLVWDAAATEERAGVAPAAVLWSMAGGKVLVSLLTPVEPYRQWCASYSPQALKDAGMVTAGRLVYRGHAPVLPLDRPEQPWDRFGFGGEEECFRTLLATLILIHQPVDARRSLHQVEEVAPSRASQKRIARMGGDPTRTVRTVTLRQSLRPKDGEHGKDGTDRIYRHRWFVTVHRRTYPDRDDPSGYSRKWVGPYLVTPPGCEDAPILGGERVNVLRR